MDVKPLLCFLSLRQAPLSQLLAVFSNLEYRTQVHLTSSGETDIYEPYIHLPSMYFCYIFIQIKYLSEPLLE